MLLLKRKDKRKKKLQGWWKDKKEGWSDDKKERQSDRKIKKNARELEQSKKNENQELKLVLARIVALEKKLDIKAENKIE